MQSSALLPFHLSPPSCEPLGQAHTCLQILSQPMDMVTAAPSSADHSVPRTGAEEGPQEEKI